MSIPDSTLTPPLTQKQSTDNKSGLLLGLGRGRYAVVQILTLIHVFFQVQLTVVVNFAFVVLNRENLGTNDYLNNLFDKLEVGTKRQN